MIYRIRGDVLDSFVLYPSFEKRVMDFAQDSNVPIDLDTARADLRSRFVNTPIASGYWLVTDDKGDICGHVCAWLTFNLGMLTVFIFQALGRFTLDQRQQWADEFFLWIREVDAAAGKVSYIPAMARVVRGELVTARTDTAMVEYLSRLGFDISRTVSVVQFAPHKVELPKYTNGSVEN